MKKSLVYCIFFADVKDGNEDSPLDVAVRKNNLDMALYLISRGCGSNEDKDKVLVEACQSGKLKVVKELVEQHSVNPKGDTSLGDDVVQYMHYPGMS